MTSWIDKVLAGTEVETDFDSGLGRLSFVCGAVVYDRPFLAPLYAFAAKVRQKTGRKVDLRSLPPYVLFSLKHLQTRLQSRHTIRCNLGKTTPGLYTERFRTDAKAEGDTVVLGGYQTRDGQGREIQHAHAKWFQYELNRSNAGWAFEKGEPFKAIAALELLSTMLGVMLLLDGDEDPDMRNGCAISVGAMTDNRGNKFAVAKLLTTKWPLAAFVVELAAQLEARDVLLDVSWVPRELNAEADAITNGETSWLSADLRVKSAFEELPFMVLKGLLEAGSIFYKDMEAVNTEGAPPTKKALGLLKVRDPWD